jgi:hypothetical protein
MASGYPACESAEVIVVEQRRKWLYIFTARYAKCISSTDPPPPPTLFMCLHGVQITAWMEQRDFLEKRLGEWRSES